MCLLSVLAALDLSLQGYLNSPRPPLQIHASFTASESFSETGFAISGGLREEKRPNAEMSCGDRTFLSGIMIIWAVALEPRFLRSNPLSAGINLLVWSLGLKQTRPQVHHGCRRLPAASRHLHSTRLSAKKQNALL